MSFTRAFLTGFALELAGAGLGLTWQETGAYSDGVTGIYRGGMPQPGPDRVVVLTPFGVSDDPTRAQSVQGLQIRTRAAPYQQVDVWDLDDSISGYLLGLYPLQLATGVTISTLTRLSSGPMGQDTANRWIYSSRYAASLGRPTLHRH